MPGAYQPLINRRGKLKRGDFVCPRITPNDTNQEKKHLEKKFGRRRRDALQRRNEHLCDFSSWRDTLCPSQTSLGGLSVCPRRPSEFLRGWVDGMLNNF